MSSPREVLEHVRATHRSAILERVAAANLPIWSRIVLPIVAVLAAILLLSTCVLPLRRLVRHCFRVLLNGKHPLRWVAGLLVGMAPPLIWTFAFKQARRIPDHIRPPIHTTVLPVLETFLLSPLGVFLSMVLSVPLAFLVWIRYARRQPHQAVFYPTVLIMFPPTLRIINDIAIGLDPSPVQDVTAWIFYGVLHFASPFIAGWWIWFFASPGAANVFGWCLGLQNLSGLVLHILNPHAAPWFHDVYPVDTVPDYSFPGNAAGLVRVDEVLGTHLYSDGFRRGPVVFGAIPSLHAATAACCALFVARYGGAAGTGFMVVYFALMCWSTMYFHHHFAVDLVAGAAIAILFFAFFAHFFLRPLDRDHILDATTRGVDRLFCWDPPVHWSPGYSALLPPQRPEALAAAAAAAAATPSFLDVDEEVQLVKLSRHTCSHSHAHAHAHANSRPHPRSRPQSHVPSQPSAAARRPLSHARAHTHTHTHHPGDSQKHVVKRRCSPDTDVGSPSPELALGLGPRLGLGLGALPCALPSSATATAPTTSVTTTTTSPTTSSTGATRPQPPRSRTLDTNLDAPWGSGPDDDDDATATPATATAAAAAAAVTAAAGAASEHTTHTALVPAHSHPQSSRSHAARTLVPTTV